MVAFLLGRIKKAFILFFERINAQPQVEHCQSGKPGNLAVLL